MQAIKRFGNKYLFGAVEIPAEIATIPDKRLNKPLRDLLYEDICNSGNQDNATLYFQIMDMLLPKSFLESKQDFFSFRSDICGILSSKDKTLIKILYDKFFCAFSGSLFEEYGGNKWVVGEKLVQHSEDVYIQEAIYNIYNGTFATSIGCDEKECINNIDAFYKKSLFFV